MFGRMLIKITEYVALREIKASQSQTIELLRLRVNELAAENAALKATALGIPPVAIPELAQVDPALIHTRRTREAEGPSLRDLTAGNINFEDLGDAEAQRQGIDHDATGQLLYR
jgi:hypothetical protein